MRWHRLLLAPRVFFAACSLVLVTSGPVRGELIIETLPSGTLASADFRTGDRSLPAVLILHGLLTTHNFNTVQVMVDDLAELGHTVLAPTLSLGISNRGGGLACDAIHTHTMEQDLAEVAWWTEWLAGHGYDRIVLVGHSIGSLHLLAYVSGRGNEAVTKLIATSLVYFGQVNPRETIDADVAMARARAERADSSLQAYTISYCDGNFLAPAHVYLSYMRWAEDPVIDAVANAPVPVHVIMGGKDLRFGVQWLDRIENAGARVTVIEGASHFFDSVREFDLLDRLREILEESP